MAEPEMLRTWIGAEQHQPLLSARLRHRSAQRTMPAAERKRDCAAEAQHAKSNCAKSEHPRSDHAKSDHAKSDHAKSPFNEHEYMPARSARQRQYLLPEWTVPEQHSGRMLPSRQYRKSSRIVPAERVRGTE